MRKAAFFYDYSASDGDVFGAGRRERIAGLVEMYSAVVTARTFDDHAAALRETGQPLRYQVTRQVLETMG